MANKHLLILIIVYGAEAIFHERSMKYRAFKSSDRSGLFGFSMGYLPWNKRLVVSDPRGSVRGQIYSCDFAKDEYTQVNVKMPYGGSTENNYLGVTIAVGSLFFATCMPRYNTKAVVNNNTYKITNSRCFLGQDNVMDQMTQLSKEDRLNNSMSFHPIEGYMDTFGWSMTVTANDTLLIGGPAMMMTGAVLSYNNPRNTSLAPHLIGTRQALLEEVEYNMGYSVASGNYFSEDPSDLVYAIGSTYGKEGFGKIIFLNRNYDVISAITDETPSVMFAGSLCTAMIDEDGKSDLLVGAPTYTKKPGLYDTGSVIAYVSRNATSMEKLFTIAGEKVGGRFGSSIINVGDIDMDAVNDIIIAAPYEDEGQGAVYVYSGMDFRGDTPPQYLQRIPARNKMMSFGFSIAYVSDFDGNGTNGLAIGSPEVQAVSFVKQMPVVAIKNLHAKFPDMKKRNENDPDFIVKLCYELLIPNKPRSMNIKIKMAVELIHPNIQFAESKYRNNSIVLPLTLSQNESRCNSMTVLTPPNCDYSKDLSYVVEVSQVDKPDDVDTFRTENAKLKESEGNKANGTIAIAPAQGCRNYSNCQPKLSLDLTTSAQFENYPIGSTADESVAIFVNNTGETAPHPCLRVQSSSNSLQDMSQGCLYDKDNSTFLCKPYIRLRNNTNWKTNMTLDTKTLTSKTKELVITTELYDNCEIDKKQVSMLTFNLVKDMNFSIVRMSDVSSNFKLTKIEVLSGKQFLHKYTIINNGLTHWMDLELKMKFENVLEVDNVFIQDLDPCPVRLHFDSENVRIKSFNATCHLGSLAPKASVDITIPLRIPSKSLAEVLKNSNVIMGTRLTLLLPNCSTTFSESLETEVSLENGKVPVWIIIFSVIIGLLILCILVYIMYKSGLLKRKTKKDVTIMRKRVDSIRHSMRQSTGSRNPSFQAELEHQTLSGTIEVTDKM